MRSLCLCPISEAINADIGDVRLNLVAQVTSDFEFAGDIMELSCFIRKIKQEEIEKALFLVWQVFQQYEAPDYTKEGVQEFYKSIHDENYLSSLDWYGAFVQEKLIGVIATRNNGTHIALFFVDGKYHRKGIGRHLFQTVQIKCCSDKMTVNSSPYAVPIYHKLGFKDTNVEQTVNGLRFTPMELNVEPFLSDLAPFLDREGRLISFPSKHKKKLIALWYLAEKIEADRQYTESEINTLLNEWTLFHDPATLRRELYNKRLLNRTTDCSCYRKADNIPVFGEFIKKYV